MVRWKSVLIVAVILVFVYGIFGIPRRLSGQGVENGLLRRIHLGLDLKGGTHLIMAVNVNDAVNAEAREAISDLKRYLRRDQIPFSNISQPDPAHHPDRILIQGISPEHSADLQGVLSRQLPEYQSSSVPNGTWTLSMKPASLADLKDRTVKEEMQTIRNRIDQLGVTEPVIEEYGVGQYEILVELPGITDPGRAEKVMQTTAMLDIRQVFGGPYANEQQAMEENNGVLPPHTELLPGRGPAQNTNPSQPALYLVSSRPAVTGRDLRAGGASVGLSQMGRPEVDFSLTRDGGRRFAAFTGSHIGQQLAVVLDNKIMEVATIQQKIQDRGRITGIFSEKSAKDLALMLNSGALPASIHYVEESTVGPSLGARSIRDGVRAAIVGMVAVLIFMLIYYRGAGINADVALTMNLIILLGFLGFTGATLTLPGIAGVILTIGMGVDSNVLIFERIREELRNGKSIGSAVQQGFAHAWVTIVDTHVTTIVSAAILFIFGTGAVKGFAVTLTFGLLANIFTAVFVSRTIFDFILSRKQRGESLSI